MTYHILVGIRPFCTSSPAERKLVMDLCDERGKHYPTCSTCSTCSLQEAKENARFISGILGEATIVDGECPEDTRERSLSEEGIEAAL